MARASQSYPNYKTVHRRFQTWCRDEILRRVLTDVVNELCDKGALDEEFSRPCPPPNPYRRNTLSPPMARAIAIARR